MTLPNFFLIGAGKAGTTALAHQLSSHPDIFICKPKEPRFLCFPNGRPNFTGPLDERIYVPTSRDEYEDLFADPAGATAIGEASTWYLTYPGVAARIHSQFSEAKIVVVLRNPVERAFSHWMHLIREQVEPIESFIDACEAEQKRKASGYSPHWWYVSQSLYADGLKEYLAMFPADQVLILLYENFSANPNKTVSEIYRFLGVDDSHEPDTGEKLNVGGVPKYKALQRYLDQSAWGGTDPLRPIKRLFPKTLRSSLRKKITEANLETGKCLTFEERRYFETRTTGQIETLEGLLNRDLSSWRTSDGTGIDTPDNRAHGT
ncbi:MAG: sulfotransferase [Pseudomonadota bacterium]